MMIIAPLALKQQMFEMERLEMQMIRETQLAINTPQPCNQFYYTKNGTN